MRQQCDVDVVPHSLLLVTASDTPEIPSSMSGEVLASTRDCIAVGTLAEGDGPVRILVTDEADDTHGMHLAGKVTLQLDRPHLCVETVDAEVFRVPASPPAVHTQVWVSDLDEPDLVVLLLQ